MLLNNKNIKNKEGKGKYSAGLDLSSSGLVWKFSALDFSTFLLRTELPSLPLSHCSFLLFWHFQLLQVIQQV